MLIDLTAEQTQDLQKAITLVDFESLFSYHGCPFGALNGGCWMVAKALQQVAGGQLYYVALHVGAARFGTFVHAVVKLGEEAWLDGRGLHTKAQLLAQWSYLETTRQAFLDLHPLFFFPAHLERNLAVVESITWTIHQLLELEAIPRMEECFRQRHEADSLAAIEPDSPPEESVSQRLQGEGALEAIHSSS